MMPYVSLNASISGLNIGERRRSLNRILNRQRSITMVGRKITSAKIYSHNRLKGGTDVLEEPEKTVAESEERPAETSDLIEGVPNSVLPPPQPSTSSPTPPTPPSSPVEETEQPKVQDKSLHDKQPLSTGGPYCLCVSKTPGSIGDKRVDEIFEHVHQNLLEAGKALATLGENFEHDLKLMFVDILGRIQQWTGIVQHKLDTCKNEVNVLQKELLARTCEIDIKAREVADLKTQIADYQNAKIQEKIEEEESHREKQAQHLLKARLAAEDKYIAPDKKTERVRKKKPKDEEDVEGGVEDEEEDVEEDKEEAGRKKRYYEREKHDREETDDDIAYPSTAVQTVQEKERLKRESELESEVMRLRKENEKILKDRAEYETAIQRALLRGISSLNVETLRVLRRPSIPCCTPCPAATIPPESIVSCPAKSTKRHPESPATTVCSTKALYDKNGRYVDQAYYTTRQSCAGPCYLMAKTVNKKHMDNNMMFLLRQDDAGRMCASDKNEMSVCVSPITKRLEIPPLPRFKI